MRFGVWRNGVVLFFTGAVSFALGHGMHAERTDAAGFVFRYDDGSPVAFADIRVWGPGDGETPGLQGTTDVRGAFAFSVSTVGSWRIRVDDGLGHATETTFTAGTEGGQCARVGRPDRWARWLAGIGVIFGLAGVYVLVSRPVGQPRH